LRDSPQVIRTLLAGLGWAIFAVSVGGYRFGVADHGIHLPMLDLVLHPDRWEGDLLAAAAKAHYSWFSHIQAPFAEGVGPVVWSAVVYGVCMVATGALFVSLARTVGLSKRATVLAVAVLAFPHAVPGGIATLDPLLLHRTAALPLELGALLLLLRGRVFLGFVVVGVAIVIHAPSAIALGFGLAFGHAVLLRLRAQPSSTVGKRGLQEAAQATLGPPLAFALGASPLIVPWVLGGGAAASIVRVDHHWWAILATRVPHHLDPFSWHPDVWISFGLWLALATVASLALVRLADGPWAELRALIAVAVGCLAYAFAVGTVAGPMTRIALALQLEAWQAAKFVIFASVFVIAGSLDVLWDERRFEFVGVLALLLVATLVIGAGDEPRRFEPRGPTDPQAQVARWAAANTSEGDMFLVPPAHFGAFRALAQRPVVATWKEGGEATFSRAVAVEWKRRTERVCACDILERPGGIAALRLRLRDGWSGRTLEGIRQTAVEEGADWIVIERARTDEPGAFEAGPWVVLRAPEAARSMP
jgi:hypothetical protein